MLLSFEVVPGVVATGIVAGVDEVVEAPGVVLPVVVPVVVPAAGDVVDAVEFKQLRSPGDNKMHV